MAFRTERVEKKHKASSQIKLKDMFSRECAVDALFLLLENALSQNSKLHFCKNLTEEFSEIRGITLTFYVDFNFGNDICRKTQQQKARLWPNIAFFWHFATYLNSRIRGKTYFLAFQTK